MIFKRVINAGMTFKSSEADFGARQPGLGAEPHTNAGRSHLNSGVLGSGADF